MSHFLKGPRKENTAATSSKPPYLLSLRSSKAFIAATVCIAIFTDILLYGIIVPVLPFAMTNRIGIPDDALQQWNAILLACYTVALFVGSPLVGIYADHTSSRRWPLLIGLFALAASTLLLCLGQTVALFILGRLLQGFSAAIVWSVGLALLADTFGDKIGMAMGYSSIAMSLGLLVSPAIGGAVFANCGYYSVYYVAFGCIFLDVILRLVLIEKKVAQRWLDEDDGVGGSRRTDPENAQIQENKLETGMPAESRGGNGGDYNHGSGTPLAPAATTSAVTTSSRLTARYPKLKLVKSRRILAANWGIITQAAIMFSFDTVLPLFVKSTFHWNSTAAGLIFFCVFIPGFVSPVVGWLSDRYGARWPSFVGFVASIPILVCLRFVTEDNTPQKVLLGALLALLGVTLVFSNTPLMAEITYAIEAEEAKSPGVFGAKGVYGLGYGLFCTSFALGGSVGTLMSGYVMAGAGWATLTWALAVWAAGGAVVIGLFAGGKPPVKMAGSDEEEGEEEEEEEDVESASETLDQNVEAGPEIKNDRDAKEEGVAHAV
ncbi:MFS general substrate transporter [Cryphonectria parasitica EP155]|uniref:MFS general substrate transporter n=1 Tax=Cryphonectria parasitica (strain ATCC 38755 / EP155) TaxID=660469 RepID=A0A9P4XUD4_CRYP1|nr:MFS general substrate transporter [Cryphonectria parasitica EP155]KAF3761086.1 MFS general substrate transporter [Cryphonectria parasitica EP155]